MLNVLIVDDEYFVLKGMEAMLHSQTSVELNTYTSSNALEALDQIQQIMPDVIIADINMPVLDGLSMIEKVLDTHYSGKFIIVSGYEKIEYLKRAIQYQVADYLLKPINKEKLISKLLEIHFQKLQIYETQLFKLKVCLLQNKPIHDLPIRGNEIRQLLTQMYVSLCVVRNVKNSSSDKFEHLLSAYCKKVLRFYHDNMMVFLLNNDISLNNTDIHGIIEMNCRDAELYIGVSPPKSIDQLIEEISISMKSNLFSQSLADMVLSSLQLNDCEMHKIRCCFDENLNIFQAIIDANQNDSHFQNYFNRLLNETDSLLAAHTKAFVEIASYNFSILGVNTTPYMIRSTYRTQQNKIVDYRSLQQLIKNILAGFWFYDPDFDVNATEYSEKIFQSLLYIQQHYAEDLSLEAVAVKVNLTPSYLSYMFKKETGMCFLQYLHYIRMKIACDLLKNNPYLSVETISKHVGYRTSNHFYKTFRTQFGTSPNQWWQP